MSQKRSQSKLADVKLPEQPVDRLVTPIARFLHVEAAAGVVLLLCTLVALVAANSPAAEAYLHFWETEIGLRVGKFELMLTLHHWINDGLMAVFFFVIGMEVKQELVHGELRELRRSLLPIAAALGGMLAPAAIYLALQGSGDARQGWGVPMATDIAFVVGCLALLGSRVPHTLRVLLLTLAIADDIGAILVIAIGYSGDLNWLALGCAAAGVALIHALGRLGVRGFGLYALVGGLVWFAVYKSGIHATIAGVVVGLMTPARSLLSETRFADMLSRVSDVLHGGDWEHESGRAGKVRRLQRASRETISPLEYLQDALHPWVSFLVMPVFALANAGVPIRGADFADPVALSIAAALVLGKPVGIFACCWLAVKSGIAPLPQGLNWRLIAGGGALAGIGFTMSLFIAGLAFDGSLLDTAKVGILVGSALSAAAGMVVLLRALPKAAAAK